MTPLAAAVIDYFGDEPDHTLLPSAKRLRDMAREEQAGQWIAMTERPPDTWGEYNVTTADGKVLPMAWRANVYAKTEKGRAPRWEWYGRKSLWSVTHWMPLPEPPSATASGGGQDANSEPQAK